MDSKLIKILEIYGLLFLFLEGYILQEDLININKNMILYLKLKNGGEVNLSFNLQEYDIELSLFNE